MDNATPGPWRATALRTGGLDDPPSSYLIERANGLHIAELPAGYSANRDERSTHRANARLIAASPTLYAYVSRKAAEGDADAARIIAAI